MACVQRLDDICRQLHVLCASDDVAGARELLAQMPDPKIILNVHTMRDDLHHVLFCRPRPAMLAFLLEQGADPRGKTWDGLTVLMNACRTGRPTMHEEVALLLPHVGDELSAPRTESVYCALGYALGAYVCDSTDADVRIQEAVKKTVVLLMQNGASLDRVSRHDFGLLDYLLKRADQTPLFLLRVWAGILPPGDSVASIVNGHEVTFSRADLEALVPLSVEHAAPAAPEPPLPDAPAPTAPDTLADILPPLDAHVAVLINGREVVFARDVLAALTPLGIKRSFLAPRRNS